MSKQNNYRRLLIASGFAAVVWTAFFLLLPKPALVVTAYLVGFLGLASFFWCMHMLISGTHGEYLTNVAFPPLAIKYLLANLALSVVCLLIHFVGLWTMPVGVFLVLHLLPLGWFLWLFLGLDAGREAIEEAGVNVQKRTEAWKMFRADADVLSMNAPVEFRKSLSAVRDAIRYADPMEHSGLQEINARIGAGLASLKESMDRKDGDAVERHCSEILSLVRERGVRLKMLK